MDFTPVFLSLKLALAATVVLLLISIPAARFLVFSRKKWKFIPELIISLPMVLPPTVIGFYLLVLFSPGLFPGNILKNSFGINLLFSFPGIVVAAVVFSLPHMVIPLKNGMAGTPPVLLESAAILGKKPGTVFWKVVLPNMKGHILSGIFSSFAHTLGAFGAIIMVGGSIPGRTKVVSIAIFEKVELLDYSAANTYALILIGISVLLLGGMRFAERLKGGSDAPLSFH